MIINRKTEYIVVDYDNDSDIREFNSLEELNEFIDNSNIAPGDDVVIYKVSEELEVEVKYAIVNKKYEEEDDL